MAICVFEVLRLLRARAQYTTDESDSESEYEDDGDCNRRLRAQVDALLYAWLAGLACNACL